MSNRDIPEFTAATLPPPQQWEGRTIWRSDLLCHQTSTGLEWRGEVTQDPRTGLLYAGGGVASAAWRAVETPAADVSTANPISPAGVNAALAALSSAGGGTIIFPTSVRPWVFDDEILMPSNTSILLSPGVVISRPDPFSLTCTTVNGSKAVTVVGGSTGRLKAGQYSAQIVVGTGVPINTSVESVTGPSTFTLDTPATASGTVSLTFHAGHNIIRRQNVSNVRIMAPWGRATLDANGLAGPITGTQADYVRNCIRTAGCVDVETSGLLLTRAFFHGEIGVNNSGRVNLEDIQTYQNGYRGVHYHGDSPSSLVTDLTADKIDSLEDGQIAFQISGNDWNTGIFICYDGCRRYQVGRLRVRRVPGLGVHLNGNNSGGNKSSQISYESVIAEDAFISVGLFNGLRHTRLGSVQAKGTITQFSNVTLGTGPVQLPRYNNTGVVIPGATMMPMVLPNGTDMSKFYRGMVVLLQDISTARNVLRRIWSVDAATRTLMVFTDDNGATRAWDVGFDNTTTTVTFGTMRNGVLLSTSSDATQQMQDITVETLQIEGSMSRSVACNSFAGGTYSVDGFKVGTLQLRDCVDGARFLNFQNLVIGSFSSRNICDRRTGNDVDSIDLGVGRCNGVVIGGFYGNSVGTGATTRNGAAILSFPNGSSNVKVLDVMANNGNGSAFAVDWTGCTNIMLGDPRNAAGTALTPTGAATNGSAFKYGLA